MFFTEGKGRVIAPILMVFPIVMLFVILGTVTTNGLDTIVVTIFITLFFLIPFLVLYLSSREKIILRIVFLCVGLSLISISLLFLFRNISMVEIKAEMKEFILIIVMSISYIAACITAMIFPNPKPPKPKTSSYSYGSSYDSSSSYSSDGKPDYETWSKTKEGDNPYKSLEDSVNRTVDSMYD